MKTIYLLCMASILLLASCGLHRTTYIAPLPNTPMFGHDSEAYFNAAVSPTHFDFQGGLSFTNHIGITAGRFYSGRLKPVATNTLSGLPRGMNRIGFHNDVMNNFHAKC